LRLQAVVGSGESIMRFNSIMQHFVFWFVLVCLLPVVLISFSLMHIFTSELEQTVATQISGIADKKMDQINSFLDEHIQD
jgi:two-component system sensor histidine kinase/response regulator